MKSSRAYLILLSIWPSMGLKIFLPEMVEYSQRLGMSFGGDTNAHTSFKETVYKLELPKPDSIWWTKECCYFVIMLTVC